jgi:hypothetical protein
MKAKRQSSNDNGAMSMEPMTLLDLAYENAKRMKMNTEKVPLRLKQTPRKRVVRECQLWWCINDAASAYKMLERAYNQLGNKRYVSKSDGALFIKISDALQRIESVIRGLRRICAEQRDKDGNLMFGDAIKPDH